MTCPICDQKAINCDCTETERRQFSEIEDLEAEIERLRDERRWIPVSERLPDDYELVMVGWAGSQPIGKGYVIGQAWHDPLVGKPDVIQPTHWMPLPGPPVDE